MRSAASSQSGQRVVGEQGTREIKSRVDRSVTCSMWSPSHKGRNGDTSILIHLVLQRELFSREPWRTRFPSLNSKQAHLIWGRAEIPRAKEKR
jgi:hypothetical protein